MSVNIDKILPNVKTTNAVKSAVSAKTSGGINIDKFLPTVAVKKAALPTKKTVIQTIEGKPSLAMKPTVSESTISATPEKKWPLGFIGEAAKAAYDTAKATVEDAANRLSEATQSVLSSESTPLQRATKMGQAAVGSANIGFLPVTTQMEAAKKIPVIKYPATAASWTLS